MTLSASSVMTPYDDFVRDESVHDGPATAVGKIILFCTTIFDRELIERS